jgi:alpha-ribazole phosphatase
MRHGETIENSTKTIMGTLHGSLTEEAKEEALSLRKLVVKPDKILSSNLQRCLDTAMILYPNREIIPISELRERSWGRLQGIIGFGNNERYRRSKPYYLDYNQGILKEFEGVESLSSVLNRAKRAIDLMKKYKVKTILAVSHGALISYMINILLSEDITRHPINNLHYNKITFNDNDEIEQVVFNQNWRNNSTKN